MRANRRNVLTLALGFIALASAVVSAGCGDPPKPPPVYLPSQFVWATETYISDMKATIPTSDKPSGPTVKITAAYERGFGAPLQGNDLKGQATTTGQKVLADLVDQMKKKGWKALYDPASKGAFPQYTHRHQL